jgi:hypothetical protein
MPLKEKFEGAVAEDSKVRAANISTLMCHNS